MNSSNPVPANAECSDTSFPIHINPDTDLNQIDAPSKVGFEPVIFERLPEILQYPCNALKDVNEREVFLVGALGVLSSILPNLTGKYDGSIVESNLYCYILAPFGTGKGSLKFAFDLIAPVHDYRQELYRREVARYKSELKNFQDGLLQEAPDRPGRKLLVIPANNSKSGIIQTLDTNQGRGLIFETEGETLAQAIKMEQGNFADILLRAFHHERISMGRRMDDELREIVAPKLSIVLSSTFDQYLKLIPTIENGLFSRILHFWLTPNPEFRNVFKPDAGEFPNRVGQAGEQMLHVYQQLIRRDKTPIEFSLTPDQQQHFLKFFSELKNEIREHVSDNLDGSVNRMGLCCFRLAMLLSALRRFPQGDFSTHLYCQDTDFENALDLIAVFKRHALRTFYKLPVPIVPQQVADAEQKLRDKAQQVFHAKTLHASGKSYAAIAELILGDRGKKSKIYYWLHH